MSDQYLDQKIIDNLSLLVEDRKSLKDKRGFTDEIIDLFKFRSCGKDLLDPLGNLPEEYEKSLCHDNILIPYFNQEGNVIHIRPHKFGIEGKGSKIYIPFPLLEGKDLSTLVLAESEFKAIASCLMGVPAIGIPGISSFSKSKFPELMEVLNTLGCQRLIICFDNEVKNNPEYPNYKPDFTKRYDAQFYAFVMAVKIKASNEDIITRVATLDPSFMVKGKADIDGILAQGIPPQSYKKCIRKAVSPETFKKNLNIPQAHMSFFERKVDAFFYGGKIYEAFNCYYVKSSNAKKDHKKISNFVIRIVHSMHGPEGMERYCYFVSKYGVSKTFPIKPSHMASRQAFIQLCYEVGDYEFTGSEVDLREIWKYLFMHQTGRVVHRLSYFGYNHELETSFFANGSYRKQEFFPVDENGIIWMDDIGYKTPDGSDVLAPPQLDTNPDYNLTIKDVWEKISTSLGKNLAKVILGWTLGNFFLSEILDEYEVYPFLFLYGRTGAGKTTIVNWVSNFFGFEQKGYSYKDSSIAGIARMSSRLSMIPLWLEEYRNDANEAVKKNGFLRSIYDRSSILKGTKKEDEIKTYKARSSLIISGEEFPRDAALNSRCIMVSMFTESKNKDAYLWMEAHKSQFSSIGHHIMTNKKEYWKKIKARTTEYLDSFKESNKGVSNRISIHSSVIASVCDVFFGEDNDFSLFVGEMSYAAHTERLQEQAINVFFSDVYDMWGTGVLKFTPLKVEFDKIYLYFSGCYSEWETKYKGLRSDIPASKNVIIEQIKKEPWYKESKNVRLDNKPVFCFGFDKEMIDEMPIGLANLVSSIEEKQSQMSLGEGGYYEGRYGKDT